MAACPLANGCGILEGFPTAEGLGSLSRGVLSPWSPNRKGRVRGARREGHRNGTDAGTQQAERNGAGRRSGTACRNGRRAGSRCRPLLFPIGSLLVNSDSLRHSYVVMEEC